LKETVDFTHENGDFTGQKVLIGSTVVNCSSFFHNKTEIQSGKIGLQINDHGDFCNKAWDFGVWGTSRAFIRS